MDSVIHEYVEALRLTDEKFSEVFASQSAQVIDGTCISHCYVFDHQCRYLFASNFGARYFGHRPADMEGKHWRELGFPPLLFESFERDVLNVFATGSSFIKELPIVFPTVYGPRYFDYILYPLHSRGGGVAAVVCTLTDITRRTLIQLTAQQKAQDLDQLVDLCPLAILAIDTDLKCTNVNRVFIDTFLPDYTKEAIVGLSFVTLGDIMGLDCHHSATLRALGGQEIRNFLLKLRDKELLVNAMPIRDFTGAIVGALTIAHDVTEYERLRAEIYRLDRLNLIGEMAASIGHEVRNPLTSVRGFLQLFQNKKEYAHHKELFDIIIEELDRANLIISEFLSLAKNKIIDLSPGFLDEIILNISPLIRANAIRESKEFLLELRKTSQILIDENEIRQCIFNFSRNALEAMAAGGTLTISTYEQDDKVVLSVKDTGTGIPPEIADKLGTPFITTKEKGTGLGLPICYKIAERHKATIEVETGPTGTTFFVYFPLP